MPDSREVARALYQEVSELQAACQQLLESKALHTHPHVTHRPSAHLKGRTADHSSKVLRTPETFRLAKSYHQTAALRQYADVKIRFRRELRRAVLGFLRGRHSEEVMERLARAAFDDAYETSYRLGMKASGLAVSGGDSRYGPDVDYRDQVWVKSALRDERKYWNAFLDDVKSGAIHGRKFTPEERIEMYVSTLDHTYDVGRVVGHPYHAIVYWVVDPQKESCPVCLMLQAESPFTRDNLPGTPRDGHTCQGLYRCGCSLRIVTPRTDDQWEVARKKSRDKLLRDITRLRKQRSKLRPRGGPRRSA